MLLLALLLAETLALSGVRAEESASPGMRAWARAARKQLGTPGAAPAPPAAAVAVVDSGPPGELELLLGRYAYVQESTRRPASYLPGFRGRGPKEQTEYFLLTGNVSAAKLSERRAALTPREAARLASWLAFPAPEQGTLAELHFKDGLARIKEGPALSASEKAALSAALKAAAPKRPALKPARREAPKPRVVPVSPPPPGWSERLAALLTRLVDAARELLRALEGR
ncbi:MAG: hypothetical protein HYZ75_13610 [Elusimicrobia bacterium]|nr:hypothetical protein [Elusimicrobiota bacterium]